MTSELIEDLRRFRQDTKMSEERFVEHLRFKFDFSPEYFTSTSTAEPIQGESKPSGKGKGRGRKKQTETDQMPLPGTGAPAVEA